MADNSDWVLVERTSDATVYIDVNSIGAQDKYIVAQIMYDMAEPLLVEGTTIRVRSQIIRYLHDCRERKSGYTHLTMYSGNMARGDLLGHSPYTQGIDAVLPGTVGETQLNFVCRHPAAASGRVASPPPIIQPASANNSSWDFIVGHGSFNVFVDSRTIKKLDGNRASAWVLAEYPRPQKYEKTGEFYRSISQEETYDCKGSRLRYSEYIYHAESMGLGKVIFHEKNYPMEFVSAPPDSVGGIRLRHVCTQAYR